MADPGRRLILQIRQECRAGMFTARVHGQVDEIIRKDSANGKPFWELKVRDASDVLVLRAWSDTPAFSSCEEIVRGDCVEIEGEF